MVRRHTAADFKGCFFFYPRIKSSANNAVFLNLDEKDFLSNDFKRILF